MRMIGMAVLMAGLVMSAGSSFAGGSCCPSKKGAEKAATSACSKALSGLELSEEQQTKITAIEAACKESGSTVEACSKSREDIRALLNDDQKAKFDASWDKMKAGKDGSCG